MSTSANAAAAFYHIGTPGKPWGDDDRRKWLEHTTVHRSYHEEVVQKLEALRDRYDVTMYGALSLDEKRYPLYAVKTRNWDSAKPCVLVTGGVHGYETSGVQGAILFLQSAAEAYTGTFNLLVVPCVSPCALQAQNHV